MRRWLLIILVTTAFQALEIAPNAVAQESSLDSLFEASLVDYQQFYGVDEATARRRVAQASSQKQIAETVEEFFSFEWVDTVVAARARLVGHEQARRDVLRRQFFGIGAVKGFLGYPWGEHKSSLISELGPPAQTESLNPRSTQLAWLKHRVSIQLPLATVGAEFSTDRLVRGSIIFGDLTTGECTSVVHEIYDRLNEKYESPDPASPVYLITSNLFRFSGYLDEAGVYRYGEGVPDDYIYSCERLIEFSFEGVVGIQFFAVADKLRSAINLAVELEDGGLQVRVQYRDIAWVLTESLREADVF